MPKITGGFSTKNPDDIQKAVDKAGGLRLPVDDVTSLNTTKQPVSAIKDTIGNKKNLK